MNTLTLPSLEAANAHFVTEFLAIGGDLAYDLATATAQANELMGVGITDILDARLEGPEDFWDGVSRVRYCWNGIDDRGQSIDRAWFDEIAAWAVDALSGGDAKLLAHCHMGINRGPSAGYTILLALGWDPIEALDAIRHARPIAAIGYSDQVLAWHLDRMRADRTLRRETWVRYDAWQAANPIDVVRIIGEQRARGL